MPSKVSVVGCKCNQARKGISELYFLLSLLYTITTISNDYPRYNYLDSSL